MRGCCQRASGALLLAAIVSTGSALAQTPLDKFLDSYLGTLEREGMPVFQASCQAEGYDILLIVPFGKLQGLLVERKGSVGNLTDVIWKEGRLTFEETGGGGASYKRVTELLSRVQRLSYAFVTPAALRTTVAKPARPRC